MVKSNEPIWWSLFSAGGVVAALLVPITLLLTSLAVPLKLTTAEHLQDLVANSLLAKIYLFVVISLPLFHWAHRFRYVAVDLGLKDEGGALAFLCYMGAIGGTLLALTFLLMQSA